ncbi:uncharacterized protein LOC135213513 [Macrobrachium nipponense]|uniref:uncharacterized protein LOC135213513 n=1 Tax=Macrobrachium nipponense TaxID=159736 RepID=UPI0030C89170
MFSLYKYLPRYAAPLNSFGAIISSDVLRTITMSKSNEEVLEEILITPKDGDDIYDLMRVSYVDKEPLCVGLHMTFEEFFPLLKKVLPPTFDSKVSFGLREKSSGKLVAFILGRILLPEDDPEIFPEGGYEVEKSNHYSKVLYDLCSDIDVFRDGRFKRQLELQCLSVHPDYGNRGLGRKLLQMSEDKGKELGCDVATMQAVNAFTDRIAKKMGHSTVRRTDITTIKDGTGRPLLDVDAVRNGLGTSYFTYFMKEL